MNDLSNTISSHYIDNMQSLPFDKQFHYASRLYLWCQDETAKTLLEEYKNPFTHNNSPKNALGTIVQEAAKSPVHGSKNAAELRRPYFEKYSQLKKYVSLLFRITFMKHLYDIDARDEFYEICDKKNVRKLAEDLLNDTEALAILSTHAINFLYLYYRVILEDEDSLQPELFLHVGNTAYDRTDKIHLQLLIYLYTHCIIGESKFYYRALPQKNIATYQRMIYELEELIRDNFQDINLDNKCEFLVCAQMTGLKSDLQDKIFAEAAASISDEGSFIIDRHNNNPQIANSTLDKSEHRNVLYIMSNRTFTPVG